MAIFIESRPSMSNTEATAQQTNPADAGSLIRSSQWGIDGVLSGCIIQSVSIQKERITDTTQDQKGAVCSQLDYDEHYAMDMEVIGGAAEDGSIVNNSGDVIAQAGDLSFWWANRYWKVTSTSFMGSFQDKKRYSIHAESWRNFPGFNGAPVAPNQTSSLDPQIPQPTP